MPGGAGQQALGSFVSVRVRHVLRRWGRGCRRRRPPTPRRVGGEGGPGKDGERTRSSVVGVRPAVGSDAVEGQWIGRTGVRSWRRSERVEGTDGANGAAAVGEGTLPRRLSAHGGKNLEAGAKLLSGGTRVNRASRSRHACRKELWTRLRAFPLLRACLPWWHWPWEAFREGRAADAFAGQRHFAAIDVTAGPTTWLPLRSATVRSLDAARSAGMAAESRRLGGIVCCHGTEAETKRRAWSRQPVVEAAEAGPGRGPR